MVFSESHHTKLGEPDELFIVFKNLIYPCHGFSPLIGNPYDTVMRIYSVPSKSLFFVNFLDFKIKVFSPREIFYSLIGIYMIVSAINGTAHPLAGLVGVVVMLFGYLPYKFLPFEIQLVNFLKFHFTNDSTSKKAKKETASLLGFGAESIQDVSHEIPVEEKGPEQIKISHLDEPYTITLKTDITRGLVPVSIRIDEMPNVVNTATNRHGDIIFTMLVDKYGIKKFKAQDENDNPLYDREIEFIP